MFNSNWQTWRKLTHGILGIVWHRLECDRILDSRYSGMQTMYEKYQVTTSDMSWTQDTSRLTLDISRACHFLCAVDSSSICNPANIFTPKFMLDLSLRRPITDGDFNKPGVGGSALNCLIIASKLFVTFCRCFWSEKMMSRERPSLKYISRLWIKVSIFTEWGSLKINLHYVTEEKCTITECNDLLVAPIIFRIAFILVSMHNDEKPTIDHKFDSDLVAWSYRALRISCGARHERWLLRHHRSQWTHRTYRC